MSVRRFPGSDMNRLKAECWRGHRFDEANTYRQGRARKCRACARLRARRAYWARKAASLMAVSDRFRGDPTSTYRPDVSPAHTKPQAVPLMSCRLPSSLR